MVVGGGGAEGCWAGETEGRMEGVVSARGKGMW